MIRRLTIAFTGSLALLTACAEPPTTPIINRLDISQPVSARAYAPGEQQPVVPIPFTSTATILPEGVGQNVAQTFTPTENQWLGYLELPVGCRPGVLLNIKIRDGLGGTILNEENYVGLPPTDGTFQLFQVFDPAVSTHGIKLHGGHTYAFELAAFPGPGAVDNSCGLAFGPPGNSYAGGRSYFAGAPGNPPGWFPLPNGLPTDDEDFPFITLVR